MQENFIFQDVFIINAIINILIYLFIFQREFGLLSISIKSTITYEIL